MPAKPPAKAAPKAAPKPRKPAGATPAPAKRAAPAAAPARAPAAPPPAVPLGVYLADNRNTAIAIKRNENTVWYLTLATGMITTEACSFEVFRRHFPLFMKDYPVRRAVRLYEESLIHRDETTQKVLKRLLEKL